MSPAVSVSPEIMSGTPVFTGTRVPVRVLFDFLEDGSSIDEFLQTYDWVSRDQVISVLEDSYEKVVKAE